MLVALGRFLFRLGIAFALVSIVMTAGLVASQLPVPDVIARATAIGALLTGDIPTLIMRGAGAVAASIGAFGLVNVLSYIFTGRLMFSNVITPISFAVYLTLASIVIDGVVSIVDILVDYAVSLWGPFATILTAVKPALLTIVVFTTGYYVAVRVFGLPEE